MKLLCLIVLLILLMLYFNFNIEYFEDPVDTLDPLDKAIIEKYKKFVLFYQSFQQIWEKSIITSIGLDLPVKVLTSPSSSSSSSPPTPSRNEINQYIATLSKKIGKPLPPITDALPSPDTLTSASIPTIMPLLPKDPIPFKNAFDWMNTNMAESHAKLEKSLKGTEGFDQFTEQFETMDNFDMCKKMIDCQEKFETTGVCQEIMKCKQEQVEYDKNKLSNLLDLFANDELVKAEMLNVKLVEESKKIENQAKSGELLTKMDLPKEDTIKYDVPPGGDKLAQMQKNDPEKYKRLQSEGGSFFSLKQLIEQINGNLR